jgi:hypothetical protein
MPELLQSLLECLEIYRPALTAPSFANLVVIFTGWVLSNGTHAVTEALVATQVASRRHHEAFHRFFSRGTWSPDELGRLLFGAILKLLAPGVSVRIVVDDTLAPKKGAHVFGIGSHLDAVRSTKKFRVFCFGHCWVVLAVLLPLPFSSRVWALPVLFRLYRNKKECLAKAHPYRKKTELAREMIDVFVSWVGDRRVELAADSAYCNDTVTRGLPPSVILLGAMRPDAVLTALPDTAHGKKAGRPRKRGDVLPKPELLARHNNNRSQWNTCEATLYGTRRQIHYKECLAQWYRACGTRLLRVVIVFVPEGAIRCRVFFSTDPDMSVVQNPRRICRSLVHRGHVQEPQAAPRIRRLSGAEEEAVERTAPFVGVTYTLLVLWFLQHAHRTELAAPPVRPWYRHKRGFSFADVLRTAQRVLAPLDVLDPSRAIANLHQLSSSHTPPSRIDRRRAA